MSTLGLQNAFAALKQDLLAPEGPRISTMRNYRFAILPYPPEREFEVRRRARQLSDELKKRKWEVLDVDLHACLVQRLRTRLREDERQKLIDSERRIAAKDPMRPLDRLRGPLSRLLEGEQGLAGDVIREIGEFAESHPDQQDRTLIWIRRLGALYPFVRTSSLLRHLDGKTFQIPVVLLYPGEHIPPTGLSFMRELDPDRDYRPRIYSILTEPRQGVAPC
ncbi:MAG: BREX protein BrxB domain-containing protein [Candidatus Xenobium sp.]|jgi:hypothetical protein|nr:DUF1788 domain-containing protein [Burkholderiales bacterium]